MTCTICLSDGHRASSCKHRPGNRSRLEQAVPRFVHRAQAQRDDLSSRTNEDPFKRLQDEMRRRLA